MTILDEIKLKRVEVFAIGKRYGCQNIRIFGSVSRKEENINSDIDFLVNIDQGRSLCDLVNFQQDLNDLFKRKVDVVTEKGLHWFIKNDVLKEAIPL